MINHSAEQLERYNDVVRRLSKKLNDSETNEVIERIRAEAAIMIVALNPNLQSRWWNECCERLERIEKSDSYNSAYKTLE